MSRCYFIISVARTGHHAFLDWFARAHGEPLAFFNNALPTSPPTLRARPYYYGNHPHLPGGTPYANFRASQHDAILNFEGRQVDRIEGPCKSSVTERLGRSVRSIYFLRDPLNCVASLTKYAKRWDNRFYLRLFSQVAGFESIVNWIAEHELADRLVTFSGWRFDEAERAAIAERLGVANLPPPEKVSKFGGGSSFSKRTFDPGAARDELLSRWRLMLDDPRFLAMFCDPDARRNFHRYFALAGARELQDQAALDEVIATAEDSAEAMAIFKEKLQPYRRQLPLIHGLQDAVTRPGREFFRARIQMSTGLLLHRA